jgi:hypothetical protein
VKIARNVLDGRYRWLEDGIVPACPEIEAITNGKGSDEQAREPVAS